MAKFYGKIGFGLDEEVRPGIWETKILEKSYYGEADRIRYKDQQSDKINDDINLSVAISIVADEFANLNLPRMRYVVYKGAKWKITDVEPRYPRLNLTIGGIYNGEHGPKVNE